MYVFMFLFMRCYYIAAHRGVRGNETRGGGSRVFSKNFRYTLPWVFNPCASMDVKKIMIVLN
jgi:hypothetical protein